MRKKKSEKPKGTPPSERPTVCTRCGTCCRKGGPALHEEDKEILSAGHIGREHLITLRKGELAHSPISNRLEPIQNKLIKVAGKGKGWVCCFYDEKKSSCTLYAYRPLECRLLQCWDTDKLLSVIGKNTLTRADIISQDDPIASFIETHEKECSIQLAEDLISILLEKNDDPGSLAKLTSIVHQDLSLRSKAISEFGLSLESELFIFGRPLFKILGTRGLNFLK